MAACGHVQKIPDGKREPARRCKKPKSRNRLSGGRADRAKASLNPSQAWVPQGPNPPQLMRESYSKVYMHVTLCTPVLRHLAVLHYQTINVESLICWSAFLSFMQPFSAGYRSIIRLDDGATSKALLLNNRLLSFASLRLFTSSFLHINCVHFKLWDTSTCI